MEGLITFMSIIEGSNEKIMCFDALIDIKNAENYMKIFYIMLSFRKKGCQCIER